MQFKKILAKLRARSDPDAVKGMARFGIHPKKTYGLTVTAVRNIARGMQKDHELAERLWRTGIREARLLACLIEDPDRVTSRQMDRWARDIDAWDICDHACGNLFDRTRFAYQKAFQWSRRKEEFVKRAAFSLIAWLAVHDKRAQDGKFIRFLPLIKREARDERNYVKKAVNWALRGIGKRNPNLNKAAIRSAREIQKMDSKAAKWNAADALRELTGKAVRKRLRGKKK